MRITLKETYPGTHIPYSVYNSCWLDYLDYVLIMTVQSCLQFMMPPLICIKYITWKKLIITKHSRNSNIFQNKLVLISEDQ